MLKNIPAIRGFFLVLATAFLFGCDKEDDATPDPDDQDCQLTKVKSDTDETEFIYDSNKIIRINMIESGQLVSYQTLEYNGSSQLTKSTAFAMNGTTAEQTAYTTFEYTSAGLRNKETIFRADPNTGSFTADEYIAYEYNTDKQLTKTTYFEKQGSTFVQTGFTIFTTDTKGNITHAESYTSGNGQDELEAELEMEYDTKPNILRTIATHSSDLSDLSAFRMPATFSANNLTKMTVKVMSIPFATLTNTYTTNSEGQVTSIALVLSSPFDPNLNESTTANLEYTCQ